MDFDKEKVKLQGALTAQHQLIALALAASHRELANPDEALKEFGDAFVEEWKMGIEQRAELPEPIGKVLLDGYSKEMASVMKLAAVLVRRMNSAS